MNTLNVYIALGAMINELDMSHLVDMLSKNKSIINITDDRWDGGIVAINNNGEVSVSNPNAKVIVSTLGEISIVKIDPEYLIEMVSVLEVVYKLSKPLIAGYFTSGIPVNMPENPLAAEYADSDKLPILPLRVGAGKRKSKADVIRILSQYQLSHSNRNALTTHNNLIYRIVKKMGGTYTDLITDVVVRIYGDTHVIVEADTFALMLPAEAGSGFNVPYTSLSSIDARNVDDLQEVCSVLHALDTIVLSHHNEDK